MANQEHLDILAKGVGAWNEWREHAEEEVIKAAAHDHGEMELQLELVAPDLSSADLRDADLHGANLRRANLLHTHLSRANLNTADFRYANLEYSVIHGASARAADFRGARLRHVDLRRTDLRDVLFGGADLRAAELHENAIDGADFGAAIFGHTVLANLDLSVAHGLGHIHHDGPAVIGLETVYRSKGRIPEAFLRGCGVPDNFIMYMKSLTSAAFKFYSCFISYSTKDQDFADRLYADLQARGVRCWFAPHDIQGGRKIHEQIDEAIRVYDKLLLILSDASMNSNWVKTEIANARARETQQKRQMLFPITLVPFDRIRDWECFDADAGKDSAREVREYFIPDFSNWKDHDSYQRAFERLVRDLKAGAGEKESAQPAQ